MPDQSAQSDWSQLRCILRELHYIELVQNLVKTKFLGRFSRSLYKLIFYFRKRACSGRVCDVTHVNFGKYVTVLSNWYTIET